MFILLILKMRLNKFCCCLSLGIGARFIGFLDFVSCQPHPVHSYTNDDYIIY